VNDMNFTKMHGLGNDYVYVDVHKETVKGPSTLARIIANRNTGVGSDGLILIGPSETADVRMEMYNADGSRGEMCGNGIRCVAKYAVEHSLATGPELTIETDAGTRSAVCNMRGGVVESVRIDMGQPVLAAAEIPMTIDADQVIDHAVQIAGESYNVTCVSVGNPHAIIFVEDLEAIDLMTIGPDFENAPQFPNRINAHFVRADSRDHVTMRTWERGSGITLACGTGACAVCVAGVLTGRTDRKIVATLPGGDLVIEWKEAGHVFMTGPAIEVFSGRWPS
jgi:diaminopimelate epimerase